MRLQTKKDLSDNLPFPSPETEIVRPSLEMSESPSGNSFASPTKTGQFFFYAVGLILIASAVTKLWLVVTDPFADVRIGLPKEVIWVSIVCDFLLAIENFRIRNHRVLAFLNTVVFASFLTFICTRMLMGFRSCGCTGVMELPIWSIALVDASIVASLLLTSQKKACSSFWFRPRVGVVEVL